MSEYTFHQPSYLSENIDHPSDPAGAGEQSPSRHTMPEPAGPPREPSEARFGPPEAVPAELRDGPIAHRFGAEDLDAVHAKLLRTVQDTSALRAAWVSDAVAHDLDSSDPSWRWALYPNGIDADVRHARASAEQGGVQATDIIEAEALGSAGVPWNDKPAHRHLGRIELLSREVFDANNRAEAGRRLVGDLAERFDSLHKIIDTLSNGLVHARSMVNDLAEDLAAHGWPTRTTGPAPDPPGPDPISTAPDADTGTESADSGHRIGDAVGAAMPDNDQPHWSPPEPRPASADEHPGAHPEVGR
ncbi:hypothetical protein K7711_19220 [Nocardia sp. CA2R105]|uniref:hypothetical protein n=1 Tax=Nocardia coffeae TaxID=2873381 RepID=UPI001CA6C894|nr:hypothetical protein [Nocardia coffeae]MBY8858618.1 hypothetical protein [Nocardia coffeae]